MKFSVLVPVYNVEKYLNKCVESVLNQTYHNYELILVDDGSTDRSGVICDDLADKDERIKVYHKKNQGLLHTRRFAIAKAQGDIFIFLDSDDYLATDTLEVVNNKFEEYNCDCVIYNFQRVIDDKVVPTPTWEKIEAEECIEDKDKLYKKVLFNQVYNSLCRKAVKSSVFDGTQYDDFYNISHGEDLLQSLEIIRNCKKTVFIPNVLYNYSINPKSITENITFENCKIDFTVAEEVLQFVKNENVFDSKTLDEYCSTCLRRILHMVIKISRFNTTLKNKKGLYNRIKKEEYYKEITGHKNIKSMLGKMRIVYFLFKTNSYGLLSILGRIT